ncbi:MAG: glycyl-radical enzyme activating protein [Oscillospiraceae bacterium]|nr:glycyl-radical enzyme activating protein [Oscillospiraceae bacterium]
MTDSAAGRIFDIQRFSIYDGPGIRTTVFLKGCPLSCIWCHNPESKSANPQIAYYPETCVGCCACVDACPNGCHQFVDGAHGYDRESCTACGVCAEACRAESLTIIGRTITVEAALAEILRDRVFYETSGGGVTLSGGEPFAQPVFTRALLEMCKREGLNTCVETCGFAGQAVMESCAPFVDLFLFDVKDTDPARHKLNTGAPLEPILDNLRFLDDYGKRIVLRCPIIPGINDDEAHFRRVAELANGLRHAERVDVEPYHPLGLSKSAATGAPVLFDLNETPGGDTVRTWATAIQRYTATPVA